MSAGEMRKLYHIYRDSMGSYQNTVCGRRKTTEYAMTIALFLHEQNHNRRELFEVCQDCLDHPDFALLLLADS